LLLLASPTTCPSPQVFQPSSQFPQISKVAVPLTQHPFLHPPERVFYIPKIHFSDAPYVLPPPRHSFFSSLRFHCRIRQPSIIFFNLVQEAEFDWSFCIVTSTAGAKALLLVQSPFLILPRSKTTCLSFSLFFASAEEPTEKLI